MQTILAAYRADREPVIAAPDRLRITAEHLARRLGEQDVGDQAKLLAAAQFYIQRRQAELIGDSTIRRELITLRAACRLAWKAGALAFQPYVPSPPASPSRQRWLKPEEAKRLMDSASGEMSLFLRLALTTGARITAIAELTWIRVDLELGVIDFRSPGSPRRKHRAVAPISPLLMRELAEHRPRSTGPRVFGVQAGALRRRLHALAEQAGIADCTPHVLRHTVATWLLSEAKVDLVSASRLLGHRSTAITEQVYAHVAPEHLRDAVRELDRLLT